MSLEKALIINTNTNDRVQVHFNPEEYTLSKDINYAQTGIPGLSSPITQFVNGNAQTLELELLFDTYEQHTNGGRVQNRAGEDVRHLTDKVIELMQIDPDTHAPPILLFTWGSLDFICVLARANQRFTMFNADGVPVRARLQVTFNEYVDPDMEPRQHRRQTADYSQWYVIRQGDTLPAIAAHLYDNPALWRPIARRNGISNPAELPVGRRLLVPQLPYRDPESGEVTS
jgi:nucleoid-associated protein YgaU